MKIYLINSNKIFLKSISINYINYFNLKIKKIINKEVVIINYLLK